MIHLIMLEQPILFVTVSLGICGLVAALSSWHSHKQASTDGPLYRFVAIMHPYSRRVVFSIATTWATFLYVYSASQYASTNTAVTFLTRMYGLSALVALGLVLGVGLFRAYFPRAAADGLLRHASRGFGLATFLFASLHGLCGFLGNLDGTVSALAFLSTRHRLALIFSGIAFFILFLMAITSIDAVIKWMTFRRWKILHRFVYVVAGLVIVHAFLIGSHFTDWSSMIPRTVRLVGLTVFLLELGAIYKKSMHYTPALSVRALHIRTVCLLIVAVLGLYAGLYKYNDQGTASSTHTAHSMGYAASHAIQVVTTPLQPIAQQPVELSIRVTDSTTSTAPARYELLHDRLMHLMIVSTDMTEYYHVHPEHRGDGLFTASFTPKSESRYYLYAQFKPTDQQEVLATATIATSQAPSDYVIPALTPDRQPKISSQYGITFNMPDRLTIGTDYLARFTLTDITTGEKIKDIEPYLGAFGHMAAISADKMRFLHIHPTREAKSAQERAGPDVTFMTKFDQPGNYRMYAEFLIDGQLIVGDFTVEVQ